jgi:DNA repair exonuclease SbcCD nuclease subunit
MEVELSSNTVAVYSGAPERFSFKEASYRPGFIAVNLSESGISYDEQLIDTRGFADLGIIEGRGLSVEELIAAIESRLEDREIDDRLVSLKLTNVDDNTYSLLEEKYLDDIRDRCFETNFQVTGPEDFSSEDSSLAFSDLRVEFSDFIENRADVPEGIDTEEIIEIGQKYLGVALGEED